MESRLELKYVAPYLPYYVSTNEGTIIGATHSTILTKDIGYEIEYSYQEIKLFLRPLSDLVETPYVDLFVTNDIDDILNYYEVDKDLGRVEHYLVNMLLKYHFDIFGLIEKGLAMNINTI